jgi:hypothetical protein
VHKNNTLDNITKVYAVSLLEFQPKQLLEFFLITAFTHQKKKKNFNLNKAPAHKLPS